MNDRDMATWQVFRPFRATGLRAGGLVEYQMFVLNFKVVLEMKMLSKLFPSTHVNTESFTVMALEAMAKGQKIVSRDICGYMLINDLIVPLAFLVRLKGEVDGFKLGHDLIVGEEDIFEPAFLHTLDAYERAVLMPCFLILIELGFVDANLFEVAAEAE